MTFEKNNSPPELDTWQKVDRFLIIAGSLVGIVHSLLMLFVPSSLLWTILPSEWGIVSKVALTASIDIIICVFMLLAYGVCRWIYKIRKGFDMVSTILLIFAGIFLLFFSNFAGIIFLFVLGIQQF